MYIFIDLCIFYIILSGNKSYNFLWLLKTPIELLIFPLSSSLGGAISSPSSVRPPTSFHISLLLVTVSYSSCQTLLVDTVHSSQFFLIMKWCWVNQLTLQIPFPLVWVMDLFSLLRFLALFLFYDLLPSMKKNKTLTHSSKATTASVFKLFSYFTAYLKIQAKLSRSLTFQDPSLLLFCWTCQWWEMVSWVM